ncbi:hypothetical protein [Streptomyces sp. NPDC006552]|uniref:hypothetical protein n=1 Tax=Streptomyces sp. NPDC006552 TaxID=3157179 RepID=UPI0033B41285
MTVPVWFSQPYPPEGASAAEGIRNQLGSPALDLFTILVRESAQNSWDARPPGSSEPVHYEIDLSSVGPAHAPAWRDLLLSTAPSSSQLPLRDSLARGPIRLLTVSDRGTTGLGGPTRADRTADEMSRDFVSFVRNIGEPRDTPFGGGTYGFGKGIFYLLSRCGTVLIHTRCRNPQGELETRLIGCSLWRSYYADDTHASRRYTGRHWWGDASGEVIEPLIGPEADAAVRRLGLRSFGPVETGTSVVVIDPKLERDERRIEADEVADYLAETICWHLWPKMIEKESGVPAMRFKVRCEGRDVPVPDPRRHRPLSLFVAAYERMAGEQGHDLSCGKPRKLLGRFGVVKRIMPPLQPKPASRMLGIEDLVHHVCLMRPAELVVTYHAGPKPPSENQGYAGVFRGDPDMDEAYAKAEPPTHDAWHWHSLEIPDSTYVRTTFRRIHEEINKLLALSGGVRAGAARVPLGAASARFSGLVGGAWGIGGATAYARPGAGLPGHGNAGDEEEGPEATVRASGHRTAASSAEPGGTPEAGTSQGFEAPVLRRVRPRVQYVGEPYYDEWGQRAVLVQEFRLPVDVPQQVRINLAVTLPGSGGRETDPPAGARMPTLLGWQDPSGGLYTTPEFEITGGEAVWRVLVEPAPDTVTEIAIKVKAMTD